MFWLALPGTNFQYNKSVLTAKEHHKVVIEVTLFQNDENKNRNCLYSAVAAFDWDKTESMVFCQQSGDILWPRTMFYSTTSWLMLFVYQYNYFGHTKIEIDINQIHCSSLQVNLCEMSGTFLQQVAQVSNFTFRFSGEQVSRKHLHFSVPEDECGILQIVSGGHDCTVHFRPEPIVYGESYNRTRSMFYLVTGASKVISDVYRYGNYHHTLYFEGHWEHHKQNAKGKISSSSSSFSPIEENIRSPHYFYHVHFEFNLKVQQNIFDRSYFNFKSISAQWSKFWFTVVF